MSVRIGARMGSQRFGVHRFSYFIGKAAQILGAGKILDGVKIKIYNIQGTKLAEISNEIQLGILKEINFDMVETGCGKFDFTLLREYEPVEITYNHRIDVHLFGSVTPWYSGYVMGRPRAGSTDRTYKYSGYGFYNQLETCVVDQHYDAAGFPVAADRYVSAIVDHIARIFVEPKTDIVYNYALIDAMTFVVTDVNFDKVSAKDALGNLADIAQDHVVGVDENRQLFFRPISQEVNVVCIRSVGKTVKAAVFEEDASRIYNRIYIKSGAISAGSNYAGMVEDAASQATYGLREKIMTIPSALAAADALRWGAMQLANAKDPVQKGKITGISLNRYLVKAEGNARIFDKTGVAHELPIKKVIYKISASGINANLELGQLDQPLTWEILQMMRQMKDQEYLQASNVAQLSP